MAVWFAGADSDRDGRLTRAEFLADANRYFTQLDSNGNGQLDAAEVDAYEAGVLAPLSQRRGASGPPPPGAAGAAGATGAGGPPPTGSRIARRPGGREAGLPPGAGLYGLINSPHPVKAADRDMNSRVDKAEWARTLSDRFAMLDGAKLGYLQLETLPKTPAQQRLADASTSGR
ncbi:hypothetical protein [Sandaracinobacter sp.]|uniref:hypothetical protein n=1 Tax=Sandaracinobacter sp. TaxID=2487581 RepID=UPI0035B06698